MTFCVASCDDVVCVRACYVVGGYTVSVCVDVVVGTLASYDLGCVFRKVVSLSLRLWFSLLKTFHTKGLVVVVVVVHGITRTHHINI